MRQACTKDQQITQCIKSIQSSHRVFEVPRKIKNGLITGRTLQPWLAAVVKLCLRNAQHKCMYVFLNCLCCHITRHAHCLASDASMSIIQTWAENQLLKANFWSLSKEQMLLFRSQVSLFVIYKVLVCCHVVFNLSTLATFSAARKLHSCMTLHNIKRLFVGSFWSQQCRQPSKMCAYVEQTWCPKSCQTNRLWQCDTNPRCYVRNQRVDLQKG